MNTNTAQNPITIIISDLATLAHMSAPTKTVAQPKEQPKIRSTKDRIEDVYADYIDQIIAETTKWRGRTKSAVTFEDVMAYRTHCQHGNKPSYTLVKQIADRRERIKYLRGVGKIDSIFKAELLERIGVSEADLLLEPRLIARHFGADRVYRNFRLCDIIDMSKENAAVALELIFEIETRYGIYDQDRELGVARHNICVGNGADTANQNTLRMKNPVDALYFSDEEYYNLLQRVIKEYGVICRVNHDEATQLVFKMIERYGAAHNRFPRTYWPCTPHKFSGVFALDMHDVLNNEILREGFLWIANWKLVDAWPV